jgi:hypothetical protein
MQLQINRGERRHQLARRLFFANQGAFQTGDYEEIMNKATCLSLLSNAFVVWNTVQMERIVEQLILCRFANLTDWDFCCGVRLAKDDDDDTPVFREERIRKTCEKFDRCAFCMRLLLPFFVMQGDK